MAEADTTSEVRRPSAQELWEGLKQVQDPELHMSVVDLGLIYEVMIDDDGATRVIRRRETIADLLG